MTWKFWVIKLILVVLHVMTIKEECLSYMGIFGLTLRGHHRRWVWINMVLQLHLIFSPLLNPNSGFWVESKETNLIKRRQCFFVMIQQINLFCVSGKKQEQATGPKNLEVASAYGPQSKPMTLVQKNCKINKQFFWTTPVSSFNVQCIFPQN